MGYESDSGTFAVSQTKTRCKLGRLYKRANAK